MPLFPKLDLDCPTCHTWKIDKTIPGPGGSERTKTSVRSGLNFIKVSPGLASKTPVLASKPNQSRKHAMITRTRGFYPQSHAQAHQSSAPIAFENYLSILVCQKLVKQSSLLKSRIKLHLPLKTDELLYPPGSCLCMDFVFYDMESIRGFTSVLDIMFISTRYPKIFLTRSKRPPLDAL